MAWMVLNILTRNALSGTTTDLERNFVMGLRELRLKRGMTQQQLAEKLGVTQQHVAA